MEANDETLRVLRVVEGTSVDGPSLRTSIYVAGCRHACPLCHNPQSWDMNGGERRSLDNLMQVIAYNESPVTLTGGDPLYQPVAVKELVHRIKTELGYNVWCFTGFTWDEIVADPVLLDTIREVDVVVEGRFVNALRDTSLLFRGSSNQRIVDVRSSIDARRLIEWKRDGWESLDDFKI